MNACAGSTVTVLVKDAAPTASSTTTYTATGTYYIIFTPAVSGAGTIDFSAPGTGGCVNFNIGAITMTSTNEYRYAFNGKEKDDETYGKENEYDFGARIYDPRLGKWLSVDPSYKLTIDLSPYAFGKNSPIFYKDNEGKKVKPINPQSDEALKNYLSTFDVKNDDGTLKVNARMIFGLMEEKSSNYTSSLHKTVKEFKEYATGLGLNADKLDEAVNVYKALYDPLTYELGLVSVISSKKGAAPPSKLIGITPNSDKYNLTTENQLLEKFTSLGVTEEDFESVKKETDEELPGLEGSNSVYITTIHDVGKSDVNYLSGVIFISNDAKVLTTVKTVFNAISQTNFDEYFDNMAKNDKKQDKKDKKEQKAAKKQEGER